MNLRTREISAWKERGYGNKKSGETKQMKRKLEFESAKGCEKQLLVQTRVMRGKYK
jgi:hypothetical protein